MMKITKRIIWGFNPVTRVVKNKKIYSRKKEKNQLKKELKGLQSW